MSDRHLRFGIFLAPFHALNENPTQALQRDMELLEHLDRIGYDEAWVGEHHSGGFEIIACPEMFVAAAAERTRHIRLGTGVVSLPYHNPFLIADRMVQLDHMTRGRAMFGMGPGALSSDAFKLGIDPADQRRRMNESIDVIMRLMQGETVTAESDWFRLQEARLQVPPFTKPHMEMAVASSRSPAGALAAGRHGLGMLSIGGTSDDALKAHASNWGVYEQAARENGVTPDRRNWRIVSLAHVAETRAKAEANVEFGLGAFAKYFRDVATFPIVPGDIDDPINYLRENRLAVIGTPDDAIAHIERLQQGSGGFGGFLELAHNWADWEATKRSYELIARYVAPHFQGSAELRHASYDHAAANHETFAGAASQAVKREIDRYSEKKAGAAG